MENNDIPEPQGYKIVMETQTKRLSDGSLKVYTFKRKIILKGGRMRNDGTRKPPTVFTEDERTEIRRRHADGVGITRLCKDYDCAYLTMKKVI